MSEEDTSDESVRRQRQLVVPDNSALLRSLFFAGIVLALVGTSPAAAQTGVGEVYCETSVETGIDLLFGAVAGLGLPATMLSMLRSGLSYARAGANNTRRNEAREQLMMSAIGFGIIVFAITAPEIISKLGTQLGFDFSECVRPF